MSYASMAAGNEGYAGQFSGKTRSRLRPWRKAAAPGGAMPAVTRRSERFKNTMLQDAQDAPESPASRTASEPGWSIFTLKMLC